MRAAPEPDGALTQESRHDRLPSVPPLASPLEKAESAPPTGEEGAGEYGGELVKSVAGGTGTYVALRKTPRETVSGTAVPMGTRPERPALMTRPDGTLVEKA